MDALTSELSLVRVSPVNAWVSQKKLSTHRARRSMVCAAREESALFQGRAQEEFGVAAVRSRDTAKTYVVTFREDDSSNFSVLFSSDALFQVT